MNDWIEELHKEWKYRYNHPENKVHKSYLIAQILRENLPSDDKFEEQRLTSFALAMPDKYKTDDAILSYRNYYMTEKRPICAWKTGKIPSWFK